MASTFQLKYLVGIVFKFVFVLFLSLMSVSFQLLSMVGLLQLHPQPDHIHGFQS